MIAFPTEFRSALQSLRRSPGYSSFALALLTLGIGATVAVYSLLDSILLRPLPYPGADALVGLTSHHAGKGLTMPSLSASDFRDLHARARSYVSLAAFRPGFSSYVPSGGDPVQLVAALVTEEFFPTFGVAPLHGLAPRPDAFTLSGPRVALLSHAAWQRHFAGRRDLIGQTVIIDDTATTVIGVMPDHFREPDFVDLWLPFPVEAPENLARDSRFWNTIGRLKPGIRPEAAAAEAAVIAASLAHEYPAINAGWTLRARPLLELRVGDLRGTLLLLLGAVGLVLLLACANLANLLLARGVARLPEFAVRLALGASPATLARGVLLESGLLAAAGGVAGAALAAVAVPLLARQLPAGLVPRSHAIAVASPALAVAAGLAVLTGLVFGLLPAWQAGRIPVNALLKTAGTRAGGSRFTARAQSALVVGQVALTLVVLSSATLLTRRLLDLERTPAGFDPRDVLAVRLAPPPTRWETPVELAAYYDRALAEVLRLPGVTAAAINSSAPLCGISLRYPLTVERDTRAEATPDEAVFNAVSPGYVRTLRLPLLQGRDLNEGDTLDSTKVCLINRALATRLFGETNPIGRRVRIVPWLLHDYREIVGVVGDTRQDNLSDPPPAQIYVPQAQSPWFFSTLLIRAPAGAGLSRSVQAALQRADPTASFSLRALEDNIARTTLVPRLRSHLVALFGAVALGLSLLGLYASLTFGVRQQRRDIGVRMALGASPAVVFRDVLGRAARLSLLGVGSGIVAALALAQVLRGTVEGALAPDPWVLLALAALLPLACLLACAAPAAGAARLDPARALQSE